LDRTQWLSPGELAERQFQQLSALVAHCFEQVPYYRRVLTAAGLTSGRLRSLDEFRRLPLLTRTLYQTHAAELKAKTLPAGMSETGEAFTSGTNGVPIRVLKTNREGLWWGAFFLRDLEWCGMDPRGRLANIRLMAKSHDELPRWLAGVSFPYWTHFCHGLLETGPAFTMDIRQDPVRQLAWLRQVEPHYLCSLPSNLEFLAGLVQESGSPLPQLRAIQAVGESLSDDQQERIEAGFGVPVKNTYSSTEGGYSASPCPLGHGLHVHAENLFVEVLDEADQPCLPGQTGRLVMTPLHNFLTPLLRYDILDEVTLGTGPCRCGRGLPLWTRVDGRRQPLMHLPNGKRKSVIGIVLGARQVGGLHQFQIVQRAVDHMVLRIVPDRSWNDERAERMRHMVCAELEAPVRVDVELNTSLERPAGGKLKIAIVEMEST
jgi:phenylacetate-CoA ligase